MIFERAQGKANVASLVERKTRFAVLFRNNDRSTTHLVRPVNCALPSASVSPSNERRYES